MLPIAGLVRAVKDRPLHLFVAAGAERFVRLDLASQSVCSPLDLPNLDCD